MKLENFKFSKLDNMKNIALLTKNSQVFDAGTIVDDSEMYFET